MPTRKIKPYLPPGRYFMQGDEAVAEGAIAAGCRFYAGYPITPASEVILRIERRLREVGGVYFQGEDEIASIAACIGASWTGTKAMTATSGPGFDLMIENLGYAIMTETPLVLVDVQRAGPSTGQAARPSQGDFHQARYASHGDYEIIVLSPWSVQEMFEMGVKAFNLAEKFRTPVIILTDEAVGHLREPLDIPEEIEIFDREHDPSAPPFGMDPENPTPMPLFGDGADLLITGSTHTEWGLRRTRDPETQKKLLTHLIGKIRHHLDEIVEIDEKYMEEADVAIVSYGISARSALEAARRLREKGIKAGFLRLKTIWPFHDELIRNILNGTTKIFVPEMNIGHLNKELERVLNIAVISITRIDSTVLTPGEIVEKVEEEV